MKKRVDDLHYEGFLEIRDFDVESFKIPDYLFAGGGCPL